MSSITRNITNFFSSFMPSREFFNLDRSHAIVAIAVFAVTSLGLYLYKNLKNDTTRSSATPSTPNVALLNLTEKKKLALDAINSITSEDAGEQKALDGVKTQKIDLQEIDRLLTPESAHLHFISILKSIRDIKKTFELATEIESCRSKLNHIFNIHDVTPHLHKTVRQYSPSSSPSVSPRQLNFGEPSALSFSCLGTHLVSRTNRV